MFDSLLIFTLKNQTNHLELLCAFSAVVLVGGTGPQQGYVYAFNPVTKIYGPVCDDYFDIKAVS